MGKCAFRWYQLKKNWENMKTMAFTKEEKLVQNSKVTRDIFTKVDLKVLALVSKMEKSHVLREQGKSVPSASCNFFTLTCERHK